MIVLIGNKYWLTGLIRGQKEETMETLFMNVRYERSYEVELVNNINHNLQVK